MIRAISFVLFALLTAVPALAQDKPADMEAIFRAKIQADKKLVVASNLSLSQVEANAFWPVYDAYQADLNVANMRIANLIKAYAVLYQNDAITEDAAIKIVTERVAIEEMEASRDRSFVPKLSAVLSPVKVMRYLQVESKIRAYVRYELANAIPLAQ